MRPTFTKTDYSKRYADEVRGADARCSFPKTDCNYHAGTLTDFNGRSSGRCAKNASFREISASYFKREARHIFAAEAAFFAMIVITSAVPLVSNAHALVNLLRSLSSL